MGRLTGRRRILSIRRTADGRWFLAQAGAPEFEAALETSGAAVGPWIWLTWRTRNGRHPVLLDDAVIDSASMRALRRILRLERGDLGRRVDNNW